MPRKLTEEDVVSFNLAANKRMSVNSRDDIIRHLERRNPWRWWRFKKDYIWVQRQMVKMGYSPTEAKDLL